MSLLILLSPSKTQELGHCWEISTTPQFHEKAELLVDMLKKLSPAELAEVMEMSDKLALITTQRFADFTIPPRPENSRQALLGFRGDVFSEIEADSYGEDDYFFAQEHLRILSGLYGILRPLDLIQPYRLEIGGRFSPKGTKNLYDFWREDVTASVNEQLAGLRKPLLLNLASNEYFKAVDTRRLIAPVMDVYFKQKKGGSLRTVAIHAKKARGALTNFILRNRIDAAADLRHFSFGEYTFREDLSTDYQMTFVMA